MAWDTTLRKSGKTNESIAHIILSKFECGDTPAGIMFTLGGMYVDEFITKVSKKALKRIKRANSKSIIKGKGVKYNSIRPVKMGVTIEHTLPINELYSHFKELFEESRLTEKYIVEFMKNLFVAVITKDENIKLSKAGYNMSMPNGNWKVGCFDPLERYRAAKLPDSIWAKI